VSAHPNGRVKSFSAIFGAKVSPGMLE